MTYREQINAIHDCILENYNTFEVNYNNDLIMLTNLRKGINENQRTQLETNIGKTKDSLKAVKRQELRLREIFTIVDKLNKDNETKALEIISLNRKIKEQLK